MDRRGGPLKNRPRPPHRPVPRTAPSPAPPRSSHRRADAPPHTVFPLSFSSRVPLNFLAHALPLLDPGDPLAAARVVGANVPDLLSVADRRVRLRSRHLDAADAAGTLDSDPGLAAFAAGVRRHLRDDGWFHATRAFAEVTSSLGVALREAFGPGDGFRCGFLGHIGTEMLLDDVLAARLPGVLGRYYDTLDRADAAEVQGLVNSLHPVGTGRLVKVIDGFRASRFLEDYATPAGVLYRMNQVCKRVGLVPLPAEATGVLADARGMVDDRRSDLLPPARYAWPPAADPPGESP